jgi:nucleoside-diphosphate-sugar epimerase
VLLTGSAGFIGSAVGAALHAEPRSCRSTSCCPRLGSTAQVPPEVGLPGLARDPMRA